MKDFVLQSDRELSSIAQSSDPNKGGSKTLDPLQLQLVSRLTRGGGSVESKLAKLKEQSPSLYGETIAALQQLAGNSRANQASGGGGGQGATMARVEVGHSPMGSVSSSGQVERADSDLIVRASESMQSLGGGGAGGGGGVSSMVSGVLSSVQDTASSMLDSITSQVPEYSQGPDSVPDGTPSGLDSVAGTDMGSGGGSGGGGGGSADPGVEGADVEGAPKDLPEPETEKTEVDLENETIETPETTSLDKPTKKPDKSKIQEYIQDAKKDFLGDRIKKKGLSLSRSGGGGGVTRLVKRAILTTQQNSGNQAASVPSTGGVDMASLEKTVHTVAEQVGVAKGALEGGAGGLGSAAGAEVDGETAAKAVEVARQGQKISMPMREEMEEKFGRDLSNVEVFIAPEACELANAEAFAVKNIVAFKEQPDRALLVHELTHVIQQGGHKDRLGAAPPNLPVSKPGDASEREAEVVAREHGTQITEVKEGAGMSRFVDVTGSQNHVLGSLVKEVVPKGSIEKVEQFQEISTQIDGASGQVLDTLNAARAFPVEDVKSLFDGDSYEFLDPSGFQEALKANEGNFVEQIVQVVTQVCEQIQKVLDAILGVVNKIIKVLEFVVDLLNKVVETLKMISNIAFALAAAFAGIPGCQALAAMFTNIGNTCKNVADTIEPIATFIENLLEPLQKVVEQINKIKEMIDKILQICQIVQMAMDIYKFMTAETSEERANIAQNIMGNIDMVDGFLKNFEGNRYGDFAAKFWGEAKPHLEGALQNAIEDPTVEHDPNDAGPKPAEGKGDSDSGQEPSNDISGLLGESDKELNVNSGTESYGKERKKQSWWKRKLMKDPDEVRGDLESGAQATPKADKANKKNKQQPKSTGGGGGDASNSIISGNTGVGSEGVQFPWDGKTAMKKAAEIALETVGDGKRYPKGVEEVLEMLNGIKDVHEGQVPVLRKGAEMREQEGQAMQVNAENTLETAKESRELTQNQREKTEKDKETNEEGIDIMGQFIEKAQKAQEDIQAKIEEAIQAKMDSITQTDNTMSISSDAGSQGSSAGQSGMGAMGIIKKIATALLKKLLKKLFEKIDVTSMLKDMMPGKLGDVMGFIGQFMDYAAQAKEQAKAKEQEHEAAKGVLEENVATNEQSLQRLDENDAKIDQMESDANDLMELGNETEKRGVELQKETDEFEQNMMDEVDTTEADLTERVDPARELRQRVEPAVTPEEAPEEPQIDPGTPEALSDFEQNTGGGGGGGGSESPTYEQLPPEESESSGESGVEDAIGIMEPVVLQPIIDGVTGIRDELTRNPVEIPETIHSDLDTPPQNAVTEKHEELNDKIEQARSDMPSTGELQDKLPDPPETQMPSDIFADDPDFSGMGPDDFQVDGMGIQMLQEFVSAIDPGSIHAIVDGQSHPLCSGGNVPGIDDILTAAAEQFDTVGENVGDFNIQISPTEVSTELPTELFDEPIAAPLADWQDLERGRMEDVSGEYSDNSVTQIEVTDGLDLIDGMVPEFEQQISELGENYHQMLSETFASTVEDVTGLWDQFGQDVVDIIEQLGVDHTDVIDLASEEAQTLYGDGVTESNDKLREAHEQGVDHLRNAGEEAMRVEQDTQQETEQLKQDALAKVPSMWGWTPMEATQFVNELKTSITQAWSDAKSTIDEALDQAEQQADEHVAEGREQAVEILDSTQNDVDDRMEQAHDDVLELTDAAVDEIESTEEQAHSDVTNRVDEGEQQIEQQVTELDDERNGLLEEQDERVTADVRDLYDEFAERYQDYNETIQELHANHKSEPKELVDDMLQQLPVPEAGLHEETRDRIMTQAEETLGFSVEEIPAFCPTLQEMIQGILGASPEVGESPIAPEAGVGPNTTVTVDMGEATVSFTLPEYAGAGTTGPLSGQASFQGGSSGVPVQGEFTFGEQSGFGTEGGTADATADYSVSLGLEGEGGSVELGEHMTVDAFSMAYDSQQGLTEGSGQVTFKYGELESGSFAVTRSGEEIFVDSSVTLHDTEYIQGAEVTIQQRGGEFSISGSCTVSNFPGLKPFDVSFSADGDAIKVKAENVELQLDPSEPIAIQSASLPVLEFDALSGEFSGTGRLEIDLRHLAQAGAELRVEENALQSLTLDSSVDLEQFLGEGGPNVAIEVEFDGSGLLHASAETTETFTVGDYLEVNRVAASFDAPADFSAEGEFTVVNPTGDSGRFELNASADISEAVEFELGGSLTEDWVVNDDFTFKTELEVAGENARNEVTAHVTDGNLDRVDATVPYESHLLVAGEEVCVQGVVEGDYTSGPSEISGSASAYLKDDVEIGDGENTIKLLADGTNAQATVASNELTEATGNVHAEVKVNHPRFKDGPANVDVTIQDATYNKSTGFSGTGSLTLLDNLTVELDERYGEVTLYETSNLEAELRENEVVRFAGDIEFDAKIPVRDHRVETHGTLDGEYTNEGSPALSGSFDVGLTKAIALQEGDHKLYLKQNTRVGGQLQENQLTEITADLYAKYVRRGPRPPLVSIFVCDIDVTGAEWDVEAGISGTGSVTVTQDCALEFGDDKPKVTIKKDSGGDVTLTENVVERASGTLGFSAEVPWPRFTTRVEFDGTLDGAYEKKGEDVDISGGFDMTLTAPFWIRNESQRLYIKEQTHFAGRVEGGDLSSVEADLYAKYVKNPEGALQNNLSIDIEASGDWDKENGFSGTGTGTLSQPAEFDWGEGKPKVTLTTPSSEVQIRAANDELEYAHGNVAFDAEVPFGTASPTRLMCEGNINATYEKSGGESQISGGFDVTLKRALWVRDENDRFYLKKDTHLAGELSSGGTLGTLELDLFGKYVRSPGGYLQNNFSTDIEVHGSYTTSEGVTGTGNATLSQNAEFDFGGDKPKVTLVKSSTQLNASVEKNTLKSADGHIDFLADVDFVQGQRLDLEGFIDGEYKNEGSAPEATGRIEATLQNVARIRANNDVSLLIKPESTVGAQLTTTDGLNGIDFNLLGKYIQTGPGDVLIRPLIADVDVTGSWDSEGVDADGTVDFTNNAVVQLPADMTVTLLRESSGLEASVTDSAIETITGSLSLDFSHAGTRYLNGTIDNATFNGSTSKVSLDGGLELVTTLERDIGDGSEWTARMPAGSGNRVEIDVRDNQLDRMGGNLTMEVAKGDETVARGSANGELTFADDGVDYDVTVDVRTTTPLEYPVAEEDADWAEALQQELVQIELKSDSGINGQFNSATGTSQLGVDLELGVKQLQTERAIATVNGTWDFNDNEISGGGTLEFNDHFIVAAQSAQSRAGGGGEGSDPAMSDWVLAIASGSSLGITVESSRITEGSINLSAFASSDLAGQNKFVEGNISGQYDISNAAGFEGTVSGNVVQDVELGQLAGFDMAITDQTNMTASISGAEITSATGQIELRGDMANDGEGQFLAGVNGTYDAETGVSGQVSFDVTEDILAYEPSNAEVGFKIYVAEETSVSATMSQNELERVDGLLNIGLDRPDGRVIEASVQTVYEPTADSVDVDGQVDVVKAFDTYPPGLFGDWDWHYWLEPGSGLTVAFSGGELDEFSGALTSHLRDSSSKFAELNVTSFTYVPNELQSLEASFDVTRDKDFLSEGLTPVDLALPRETISLHPVLTSETSASVSISGNELDEVRGGVGARLDAGSSPFIGASFTNGVYTPDDGLSGEATVELLQRIDVAEIYRFLAYIDGGTGITMGIEESKPESVSAQLKVGLDHPEAEPFIEGTVQTSYTFSEPDSFEANGRMTVMNDFVLIPGENTAGFGLEIMKDSSVTISASASELENVTGNVGLRLRYEGSGVAEGTIDGTWDVSDEEFTGTGSVETIADFPVYGTEGSGVEAASGSEIDAWTLWLASGSSLALDVEKNDFESAEIHLDGKVKHGTNTKATGSIDGSYEIGGSGFTGTAGVNVTEEIVLVTGVGGRFDVYLTEDTEGTADVENNEIQEITGSFQLLVKEGGADKIEAGIDNATYVRGEGITCDLEIDVVGPVDIYEGDGFTVRLAEGSGGSLHVEQNELDTIQGDVIIELCEGGGDAALRGEFGFTTPVDVTNLNSQFSAEGSLDVLSDFQLPRTPFDAPDPFGTLAFVLKSGSGLSASIVDGDLDTLDVDNLTVNAKDDNGEFFGITTSFHLSNGASSPEITANGTAQVLQTRDFELGDKYTFRLMGDSNNISFAYEGNELQTIGGNAHVQVLEGSEALMDVQFTDVSLNVPDEEISGEATISLLKDVPIDESVNVDGRTFAVYLKGGEENTSISGAVAENDLDWLEGQIAVSIHEGTEFMWVRGQARYERSDESISVNGEARVTRDILIYGEEGAGTAPGGDSPPSSLDFAVYLKENSGGTFDVQDNIIESATADLQVKVKGGGEDVMEGGLSGGSYQRGEGFSGTLGVNMLCDKYPVATFGGDFCVHILRESGGDLTIENNQLKRAGGTVALQFDKTSGEGPDATGPFFKISATVDYDFENDSLISASGSIEILDERELMRVGNDIRVWLLGGTNGSFSASGNNITNISGDVGIQIADGSNTRWLEVRFTGCSYSADDGFTGEGSVTVLENYKLADIQREEGGPISFWVSGDDQEEGASATAYIEGSELQWARGTLPFRIDDGEGPLLRGSANGRWDASTEKFSGSGDIRLARDVDYELGSDDPMARRAGGGASTPDAVPNEGTRFKFKEGSGGSATVVENSLTELGGELTVELWRGSNKVMTASAEGTYDVERNMIERLEGSIETSMPITLFGGKITVNNLNVEGLIVENELRRVEGGASITVRLSDSVRLTGDLDRFFWSNLSGEDVYEVEGGLTIELGQDEADAVSEGGAPNQDERASEPRFTGSVDFSYSSATNAMNARGELTWIPNPHIEGTVGVEIDNNWEPTLDAEFTFSKELYEGRTLFEFAKGIRKTVPILYVLEVGGGVDFGMGIDLMPVNFTTTIGFDGWKPTEQVMPNFHADLSLDTGLDAWIEIAPFIDAGIGIANVASLGLRLKGIIEAHAPLVLNPVGYLEGGPDGFEGGLGINISFAPTIDLGLAVQGYLNVLEWDPTIDFWEGNYPLGELFSWDWNYMYTWGDAGTEAEEGGGGGDGGSGGLDSLSSDQSQNREESSVESSHSSSGNESEDSAGGFGPQFQSSDDMMGANSNMTEMSQGSEPSGDPGMMDKVELAMEWLDRLGGASTFVGFLAGMFGKLVSLPIPVPFNIIGVVVWAAFDVFILEDPTLEALMDGFNDTLECIEFLASYVADIVSDIIPDDVIDLYNDVKNGAFNIGQKIGDIVGAIIDWAKEKVSSVAGAIDAIGDWLIEQVSGAIDMVKDFWELISEGPSVADIVAFAARCGQAVADLAVEAVKELGEAAGEILEDAAELAGDAAEVLGNAIEEVWDGAMRLAGDGLEAVGDAVGGVVDSVRDW